MQNNDVTVRRKSYAAAKEIKASAHYAYVVNGITLDGSKFETGGFVEEGTCLVKDNTTGKYEPYKDRAGGAQRMRKKYRPESDSLYNGDQVPYSHLLHESFLPLFCNHRFQELGIPEEVHPGNTYGHFQDHMDFPKNRDRSKSVYNPFPNPGAFRNTDEANNHVRLPSSGKWYVPYGEKIFFSLCYI